MSNSRLKILFGFIVLIGLLLLAVLIARGNVSEQSSFGLEGVINVLALIAGAFCGWAFGSKADE